MQRITIISFLFFGYFQMLVAQDVLVLANNIYGPGSNERMTPYQILKAPYTQALGFAASLNTYDAEENSKEALITCDHGSFREGGLHQSV